MLSNSRFSITQPILLVLCFALSSPQLAVAQDAELRFKTSKITDTLYMLSGEGGFTGGNIGLTIGDDGVAMIDNGMPNVLGLLRAEIRKLTDQPVDYLINTHVHGDHIGNNHDFGSDGARIISHENLRASLAEKGVRVGDQNQPASKATLPVLTFSDRMTIHINGDVAKVLHFAEAHTDGDAVVHFVNDNVIHAGDIMFNGLFPYIDKDNGGSLTGVIAALKGIADMSDDDTQIIPGHGPMASQADVLKTVAMLEDAEAMVSRLVGEGLSDEEIIKANPLSKYSDDYNWPFITTERMTKQVIAAARKK